MLGARRNPSQGQDTTIVPAIEIHQGALSLHGRVERPANESLGEDSIESMEIHASP